MQREGQTLNHHMMMTTNINKQEEIQQDQTTNNDDDNDEENSLGFQLFSISSHTHTNEKNNCKEKKQK